MMNNKFLSMLGIARRANKLSIGYTNVVSSIKRGTSQLIIIASDISDKTKRSLQIAADKGKIKVIITNFTIFDLSCAVGQKSGIIAVNDMQFSKRLIELLNV